MFFPETVLSMASSLNSFYGCYFFLNNYVFLKGSTHHLDFKQHGKEQDFFFFFARDGLNNDAVNFSKLFNPICVKEKSHVKREKSELKGRW